MVKYVGADSHIEDEMLATHLLPHMLKQSTAKMKSDKQLMTTPVNRKKEEQASPDPSDVSTESSCSSPEPSPFRLPPAWANSPFFAMPRQPMNPSIQPKRLAAKPQARVQIFGDLVLIDGEYEEILLPPSIMVSREDYERQSRAYLEQQWRTFPERRARLAPYPGTVRQRVRPELKSEHTSSEPSINPGDEMPTQAIGSPTLNASPTELESDEHSPSASLAVIGNQTLQSTGTVPQAIEEAADPTE
jgi:hypothetical protein